jgi:hypothetical protein
MRQLRILAVLVLIPLLGSGWVRAAAGQEGKGAGDVVEAYGRFVQVRRARPVDFEALTQIYESDLVTYVREADGRYGTDLDPVIREALEKGRAGREIHAHAQIAEKSIQRSFILSFTRSLKQLQEDVPHHESLPRLLEAARVLRSAVERRSRWVGKGAEYTDLFDAALEQLQRAAEGKNRESLTEAGVQLFSLVTKVLVLSVFYELDGLEKARGKDADEASEKREEARIYHLSLVTEHRSRDEEGAAAVAGQLALPVDQIDIGLVRELLSNEFQGEIADVDPSLLGLARR